MLTAVTSMNGGMASGFPNVPHGVKIGGCTGEA